ncbi:MAG: histidinol-phosphate transaminase [Lysobacter sp.]|nr:MAG: histidinol-phosphate transaminase [Lysobacter sp.]
MTSPVDLVRADLRDFRGYRSARSETLVGDVWLNANESPFANAGDADELLRRYPDPQPDALRVALAELFGCAPGNLLAGRGSDEGIDLLVRALCTPGDGAIVVTPPTFGMYAVSARLHGTRVVGVPLQDTPDGFRCLFDAIATAAIDAGARLVFLCSPGNPTGAVLPLGDICALASRLEGRAVVVVDEAYQDYAAGDSVITRLADHANLAVLRTLSKAHALAGARIGVVIARPELIDALRRCQAPYPLPQASVAQALQALAAPALARTRANVQRVLDERERVFRGVGAARGVRRVYRSDANFLLVRFHDAQQAFNDLLAAGVVVRDMRAMPGLGDALRITIGSAGENDRVLAVLAGQGVTA